MQYDLGHRVSWKLCTSQRCIGGSGAIGSLDGIYQGSSKHFLQHRDDVPGGTGRVDRVETEASGLAFGDQSRVPQDPEVVRNAGASHAVDLVDQFIDTALIALCQHSENGSPHGVSEGIEGQLCGQDPDLLESTVDDV
ncbi:hypothetical protein LRS71_24720 [Rhodococcus pyridinivorans]|uniref:hypothetical protein n=1 Tax=Rhodococcus pyridinivorans TaxID=103816 RepID=UPI001E3BBD8E|nr:hypothetical protein [Rhodococcus pyridinivorans]MCD5422711.1 hypothetical protein [Rhodococcus pyridinivorans]